MGNQVMLGSSDTQKNISDQKIAQKVLVTTILPYLKAIVIADISDSCTYPLFLA